MNERADSHIDWKLVKRRRRELGISQVDLAAAIGAYASQVSRLEDGLATGSRTMTVPKLIQLAATLAMHPGDLLTDQPARTSDRTDDHVRRLGAALIGQRRGLRALTLAGALGLTLDELHAAADQLGDQVRPLGMTIARHNLWHLTSDPLGLTASDLAKLRGAERLRYGLSSAEQDALYAITIGELTHEPKGVNTRIGLAALINQGLVGDHDAHGYAVHPDVAYSLGLEVRPLRSTARRQSPGYAARPSSRADADAPRIGSS